MVSLRTSLTRALTAASVARCLSSTGRGGPVSSRLLSSSSTVRLARTQFFGCTQSLQCGSRPQLRSWIPSRLLGARATVKRRKDYNFDNVIQKEKKVRIVSKIKSILVKHPGRTMTLLQLGKFRRDIGLSGKRRVIALLNKFPGVFEVYEEGCNVMYVRLTVEAEEQYEEEVKLRSELEDSLVEKLRKLVMMSVDKRLTVDKIAHLKGDLGLPEDWRSDLIPRYPQYFKIVDTEAGPALELTAWDPLLAVSVAQKQAAAEAAKDSQTPKILIDGEEIVSTALSNRRLNLPKGLAISKKDRVVALKFQQHPYISPYSDATGLDPASLDAEKRACATVHELLSLTLEKRTLVDHLTHFKKDYKFSQRIRAMLIRHPEMFYVSFKGHRDSVFLREAYEGSELREKDPLVLAKQRLQELVAARRVRGDTHGTKEGGEDDDEDDADDDDDEDDDEDDEEDDSENESDEDENGEDEDFEKLKPVIKTYAPSPRRPVKSYRDLRPRPGREDSRPKIATIERPPRERW